MFEVLESYCARGSAFKFCTMLVILSENNVTLKSRSSSSTHNTQLHKCFSLRLLLVLAENVSCILAILLHRILQNVLKGINLIELVFLPFHLQ